MPHPQGQTDHLWIVVAEDQEKVAVVNLNTKREGSDETTVLQSGDHLFIKHPTVVTYADAMITRKDQIEKLAECNPSLLTIHADCPFDTVERIIDGIEASDFTPMKVVKFCIDAWEQAGEWQGRLG